MARLIVKSPYIKGSGGGAGGYAKYIGTRGLFSDEDQVNLDAAMQELNK